VTKRKDGASSDQPIESATRHAVLGPGTALYDDRRRTRLRVILWIALVPLGIFGVLLGRGDLAAGATLLGIAEVLGGIVLVVYSVQAAVEDARRLSTPIRLVIARDGFALLPGDLAVSWNEVEAISDPGSPVGQPRVLRVQLSDPGEFKQRHSLSQIARLALRFNRGDLVLGSGMAMPVANAEALMRSRLAEFQGPGSAHSTEPVQAREPADRRSSRPKRRPKR
jgi:hypothetical protein